MAIALFTIDKGIPAPPGGGTHNRKYPFNEMEVDDSFACDGGTFVRPAAAAYAKKHGKKFSVRKIGPGQFRCWRVA